MTCPSCCANFGFVDIEKDESHVPWAAAGSNVTLFLTSVDPVHLTIGNVLCPPTNLVPVVTVFTARIIVFDIQVPVMAGTSVRVVPDELYLWG